MSFEKFEDYLTINLKINDENAFQEKLESLLSKDKNKIDPAQKEKKEQEKILKQRLKDESNEKKIDFILSDETSFEQFKTKNNDIKTIREDKQKEKEKYNEDFYDINSNEKTINNKLPNETNSNFTNTNNLINEEKDKKDEELMKLGEDIKNNNVLLYNWEKIKKFKEVRDLQAGLEKDEEQKEISVKNKKKALNNKKTSIKINNNKKINITKKSNNKNIKKDKNTNNKLKNKTEIIIESQINNKEGDDDDDLIMSTMQCPIISCEKKNNKTKKYKNLFLPTYENNENIDNNTDNNNNNFNDKKNNGEKNSLLAIFKKEKEIKNKLQKILSTNPSVSQNDFFANEANKNKFYNYNSNSKYLSMAKNILINKLTNGEKNYITELDQEINKVKSQISEVITEKNYLTEKISEQRKELENFLEKKDKIEFEFERDLINDLRSIINKFKIEIYKKELTLNKKKEEKNEENKEEVEKLKKEYKLKKNDLDLFNKNCEKNIIEIQKQIMKKHYENEKMKEKIDIYEQDNKIENLEQELPEVENKKLINLNNKRENKIKLINNEEEDDNDIIINNNYAINNIIKTRAKSNHLNELDFEFPDKYFDENNKNNKIIKHQFELDGKNIIIYNSGKKEVIFPNKARKEIFPDGYTLVTYSNGDIKEIIPNYREIYYYKKDEVNQIAFEDGCKYIKYLKTGKIICNGKAIN